jgi:hypothetical protein
VFDVSLDDLQPGDRPDLYNPALLSAIAAPAPARAAASVRPARSVRGSDRLDAAVRRTRFIVTLTAFAVLLLVLAPSAFAEVRDYGGQGWAGETSDSMTTNVMFFTIAFFPAVILAFSLLQWRLDKRKHAREDAQRAREKSADWRGGW